MKRAEALKREIDLLPSSILIEVENYLRKLKKKHQSAGETKTLLTEIADQAIDDDLPVGLAEQHDHYLYGTPKR